MKNAKIKILFTIGTIFCNLFCSLRKEVEASEPRSYKVDALARESMPLVDLIDKNIKIFRFLTCSDLLRLKNTSREMDEIFRNNLAVKNILIAIIADTARVDAETTARAAENAEDAAVSVVINTGSFYNAVELLVTSAARIARAAAEAAARASEAAEAAINAVDASEAINNTRAVICFARATRAATQSAARAAEAAHIIADSTFL